MGRALNYEDALLDAEERYGPRGGHMLRRGLAAAMTPLGRELREKLQVQVATLREALAETEETIKKLRGELAEVEAKPTDAAAASRVVEVVQQLRTHRIKTAITATEIANTVDEINDPDLRR